MILYSFGVTDGEGVAIPLHVVNTDQTSHFHFLPKMLIPPTGQKSLFRKKKKKNPSH